MLGKHLKASEASSLQQSRNSRDLKSYMSFCGEFCLLIKIFLNPAKLKEEAVWLGCSVTLERMKYLVIFLEFS